MSTLEQTAASRWEEIANSVSHGIGFVAVIIAAPFLLLASARHGDNSSGFGTAVFLGAMGLLYLASTFYHGLPHGRAKQFFLKLDYSAIFLVIAATYTAFASATTASATTSVSSWSLFAVWGIAIVGLVLKLSDRLSHPLHSIVYYVAMGWLTLLAALPMAAHMPHASIFWMIIGGIVYSWGVVFYLLGDKLRFSHLGWHVLVMAGSGCHFVALLQY
jgi:hemolysin III